MTNVDVIVVGAGLGGVYAVHRLRQQGLTVQVFEAAPDVGGVWYHNCYPGARVDIESHDYCYFFSAELYRDWQWSERYAAQPEILAYIRHVADRFDIRRHIRFNTWVDSLHWDGARWRATTRDGAVVSARFVVMAAGNLSAAKTPDFPGLDTFRGEWVQTSHWPQREVQLAGRRIAVIGTGSSGVQTAPAVAPVAQHVYVFQRTPNYSVPAHNGPPDSGVREKTVADVPKMRESLLNNAGGSHVRIGKKRAADFAPDEMREELERKWAVGGHGMNGVFADQGSNLAANTIVSDFVRDKIRAIVRDPRVAERLCPHDHPMGTRRLCVDTGYYECFNRDNVTLVDARDEAIVGIEPDGIRTTRRLIPLDLIIFALGFHAFTGAFDRIDIRNTAGARPTDHWTRGPRTALGLMTDGFPNFFSLTGPGSPSVLANLFIQNEFHADWIADLIGFMDRHGHATVEPTPETVEAWTQHVAEVAQSVLRLKVRNYMVHENADGSRVFIPYIGGLGRYVRHCRAVAETGYEGFAFG